MKRILRLALPLCACMALVACSDEKDPPDPPTTDAPTSAPTGSIDREPDRILAFVRFEGGEFHLT